MRLFTHPFPLLPHPSFTLVSSPFPSVSPDFRPLFPFSLLPPFSHPHLRLLIPVFSSPVLQIFQLHLQSDVSSRSTLVATSRSIFLLSGRVAFLEGPRNLHDMGALVQ